MASIAQSQTHSTQLYNRSLYHSTLVSAKDKLTQWCGFGIKLRPKQWRFHAAAGGRGHKPIQNVGRPQI